MTKNNPYVAKGCSVLFPLMSCKAPNTTDGFRCAACHPGYTASADKKKCAVTKIITPGCSGYKETDGTTCAKGFKGYTCGAKSCTVTTPMVSCKVHVAFDGTKVKTASDLSPPEASAKLVPDDPQIQSATSATRGLHERQDGGWRPAGMHADDADPRMQDTQRRRRPPVHRRQPRLAGT